MDDFLAWVLDSRRVEQVLHALGPRAVDELQLRGDRRDRLLALHAASSGLGSGDERLEFVAAIAKGTQELLEPGEYQRYRLLMTQLLETAILEPRAMYPSQ